MSATRKKKKKGFKADDNDDGESDWETDYDFYLDQYKVRKIINTLYIT